MRMVSVGVMKAVSPDAYAFLWAGRGKAEGLEGMISRPLRGAQGQSADARRQGLFQPEKSHIATVCGPPPFCHNLGMSAFAACSEDQHHILRYSTFFGLRSCRNNMGTGRQLSLRLPRILSTSSLYPSGEF